MVGVEVGVLVVMMVGVLVGVIDSLGVGVRVRVLVGVLVGINDNLRVGVMLAVKIEVGVGVAQRIGVAVGTFPSPSPMKLWPAAFIPVKPKAINSTNAAMRRSCMKIKIIISGCGLPVFRL